MVSKRQIKLLNDEIDAVLEILPGDEGQYSLRANCSNVTKFYLDNTLLKAKPWPLLPLLVCESITGRYQKAIPLAVSLHLLKTAAEIFDDIEDADKEPGLKPKYESAAAINVGTALIMLSEKELLRLVNKGIDTDTIIRILDLVDSTYVTACIGQNMEFSCNSKKDISEDTYFRMIEMKAAGSIQCACTSGAILSGAVTGVINNFSDFGRNIGIAAQIANDISGIINNRDIINKKITLPVIFAFSNVDKIKLDQLNDYYQKHNTTVASEEIKNILYQSGALYYATVKMDLYKQNAQDILSSINKFGINTKKLGLFLK